MINRGVLGLRVCKHFLAVALALAGSVATAGERDGDSQHIIEYSGQAQYSASIYAEGVYLNASAHEIREPELVIRNDTRFPMTVTRVDQGTGPVLAPNSRIRWSCDEAELELVITVRVQAEGSPMEYIKLSCGAFLQISEIESAP